MRTASRKVLSLVFVSCFLFLVSCFILITPVKADSPPWNAQSQSTYTLGNLIQSGITGLSGDCTDKNGSIQTGDKITPCKDIKTANGGAIALTSSILTSLYNPPTSSVYYLANLGEGLGIGPNTAYAQVGGSGQSVISPVFKLWQMSRNLTYLIFIVVFVVVGFMIMFRQKLNPQTVIGVQQALPGLIVGLILVTFSYFIASLIVDIAFYGVQLVAQFFILSGTSNTFGDATQINNLAQNANIFNLYGSTAFNGNNLGNIWKGISEQLTLIIPGNNPNPISSSPGMTDIIVNSLKNLAVTILSILNPAVGAISAIPTIVPALVCLILLIAIFIQMFKLLFALLKAYITILIMTLAGPFFILAGAIPGKSKSISSWLKNLVANVLIFPAVFAAFLFAGVILGDTSNQQNYSTLPLFGGLGATFIKTLIAYGIILGAAGIPDTIKGAFGIKDQNPFVSAATAGAMMGTTVGTTAVTAGHSNLWRGGAQAGQPAKGPIAAFAKNRGWYRPTVGKTGP